VSGVVIGDAAILGHGEAGAVVRVREQVRGLAGAHVTAVLAPSRKAIAPGAATGMAGDPPGAAEAVAVIGNEVVGAV